MAASGDFSVMMQQLQVKIEEEMKSKIAEIEEAYNQLVSEAKKVLDDKIETIKIATVKPLDDIEVLIQHAESLGVDVTECVTGRREAIANLPNKVLSILEDKYDAYLKEADTIAKKSIEAIKRAGTIDKLQEEQNGGNGFSAMTAMASKAMQIPIKIAAEVTKANLLIGEMDIKMTNYVTPPILEAFEELKVISHQLTQSIRDKIELHSKLQH